MQNLNVSVINLDNPGCDSKMNQTTFECPTLNNVFSMQNGLENLSCELTRTPTSTIKWVTEQSVADARMKVVNGKKSLNISIKFYNGNLYK